MRLSCFLVALMLCFGLSARGQAEPSLKAPLVYQSESLGSLWVYPNANPAQFFVESKELRALLAPLLDEERFHELTKDWPVQGKVALSRVNRGALNVTFQEDTLELKLEIGRAWLKAREFQVRKTFEQNREHAPTAAWSGYINAYGSQNFLYPRKDSRQPVTSSFDFVNNVRSYVLETGADFREKSEYEWRRKDTRLTKDIESKMLRLTAGDLQLNTVGYQNALPMGGVAFSRQYSIQPYLITSPRNRTEIFLDRPSLIEVYVNDAYTSRVQGPAGLLNLSDFPLFSGINKVDLKITDDLGKVQWINLNMLYDVQVLGEGIQQFSYQAGLPSEDFRTDRRYLRHNSALSGFHRFGVSDHVTLGLNFQNDRYSWLSGFDSAFLTRWGVFTLESAMSHHSGKDKDYHSAHRLLYRSIDYKSGATRRPIRFSLAGEYLSRRFSGIGTRDPVNEYSWRYDIYANKALSEVSSLGTGFQYQINRLGAPNAKIFRFDLSSAISSEWRASLNYSYSRTTFREHRGYVALTWLESSGHYYGSASYDYPAKVARIEGTRNPRAKVGDYRATAALQNSPSTRQGDATIEYLGERATVRAEHSSANRINSDNYRYYSHSSTLTLGTALVWADGTFALSRPVADSFVLIRSKSGLSDQVIPVNPGGESAEARVNAFGPAVLAGLTSYNVYPVVLSSRRLPVGYSLGKEFYTARPTYRSGTRIDIGESVRASLKGQLILSGQAPLALTAWEAVGGDGSVTQFFTNREGEYLLEGLNPGVYQLRSLSGEFTSVRVSIQPAQTGLVTYPPLQVQRTEANP